MLLSGESPELRFCVWINDWGGLTSCLAWKNKVPLFLKTYLYIIAGK